MVSSRVYKEARKHFGLKPGDGLVLHHKDPTLKTRDPERYNEWRTGDLVVMTREEHTRLHHIGNKKRKGKKHSEESRKKISKTLSGKNTIPVCQYALNGELVRVWESAIKAEKEGGFNHGHITEVCRGKRKSHKNYIWKYSHDKT